MLLSDKGTIVVNGDKTDIMADLASLLNHVFEDQLLTEEEVNKCIEIAKWSEEELDLEVEKATKAFKEDIRKELMHMVDKFF